jgi:hypothetical protein
MILSGVEDEEQRFKSLQHFILKLSSGDDDDDLPKNIKWLNTTFNVDAAE